VRESDLLLACDLWLFALGVLLAAVGVLLGVI